MHTQEVLHKEGVRLMGDRDGVQSGVCVWRGTVELLCVMIGGAAFRKGYVIAVPKRYSKYNAKHMST
jgi:hypothetical protein